jgi:hypothetical protein
MKRDMELVRELLIYLDEKPDDKVVDAVEIEGYDRLAINYHLLLLYEAGYIAGEPVSVTPTGRPVRVLPMRLKWEGHEFLSAARDVSVWKTRLAKIATRVADVPVALLGEALIQTARAHLGGPSDSAV